MAYPRNPFWMITVLAVQSCSVNETSELKEQDRLAIEKEVRSTLNEYYADIRKTGLTGELTYLDSSDNFFWVPPGSNSPLSRRQ